MRAVIQRTTEASVEVEGEQHRESIGRGFVVLLGVGDSDTDQDCEYIARKIAGMRVFDDEMGKMNLSLKDTGGKVLLVSQFTLFGDCRKGRRPSFSTAAAPDMAKDLYGKVALLIRKEGITVKCGRFQQLMKISIVNYGPVTLLLDSKKTF